MRMKIAFGLLILFMALYPNYSWCQQKMDEETTMRAFGGHISIPSYMEVIVQFRSKESIEVRILRKLDSEGEIRSIIINRPSHQIDDESKGLALVDQYEVNDFFIKFYEPNAQLWSTKLKVALISRCGEVGQLVVESKQALDKFLAQASPMDCT